MQYNINCDLIKFTDEKNILINEPMKLHTSFKVGGPADYFVSPATETEFASVLKFCRENSVPCMVIGNGSNILVSDKGIRGVVLSTSKLNKISVNDDVITAQSGAHLAKIAAVAQKNSLSGFEFASGIPGTLGGAVAMNAGAYGGEMKDVVIKTECCDVNGNVLTVSGDSHEFSYRKSIFSKHKYFILNSELKLKSGNPQEISALMKDLNNRRLEKQPLNYPSAGSTFKRPQGYFAGKLIEDSGLKGKSVNDACVSEKHCGFIINKGNATCDDIIKLIEICQKTVFKKYGVELEPEVKLIGEF